MDEDYLYNMGMGGDYSALAEDDLAPFNSTMADAINSTGAASVTPKTSGLANLFNSLVVAPSGGQNTGSTLGNVLNYFSQSLIQKPTTPQQQITQQRLSGVLYGSPSGSSSSLFSNPLVWIGILVFVVLMVIILRKTL